MSVTRLTVDQVHRADQIRWGLRWRTRARGADSAHTWLTRTRHGGWSAEVDADVDGGECGGARIPTARRTAASHRRRVVREGSWRDEGHNEVLTGA